MSQFHQTRLSIRAVLISALLVFGHILLTTAASVSAIPQPELLAPAIKSTSSLIFLTLLWTSFTLLESVDTHLVPSGLFFWEDDQAEGLVFGRTWVEFVLNSSLLAAWAIWAGDARFVMSTYSTFIVSELALIPIAYGASFLALAVLQAHITYAILRHISVAGLRSVFRWSFWTRKTGHWTEHITLGEMGESEFNANELEEKEDVWGQLGVTMGRAVTRV